MHIYEANVIYKSGKLQREVDSIFTYSRKCFKADQRVEVRWNITLSLSHGKLEFLLGRFGTTSFKVAMFTSGSFKNEVAVLEERPRNTVNQLERTVALVPRWENNSFPFQGVFVSNFVHWRDLNCYRPIPCKHWVAVSCLPRVGVGGGQVLFNLAHNLHN